jgi:hypothetical protein
MMSRSSAVEAVVLSALLLLSFGTSSAWWRSVVPGTAWGNDQRNDGPAITRQRVGRLTGHGSPRDVASCFPHCFTYGLHRPGSVPFC